MADVIVLFKNHIEDLFGSGSTFTAIPRNRIRVDIMNTEPLTKSKRGQSIVLSFDSYVIKAYETAIDSEREDILKKYVKSLRELIQRKLRDYNPEGNKGVAFQIEIDSEATDL